MARLRRTATLLAVVLGSALPVLGQITTNEREIQGLVGFSNSVLSPPALPENTCAPLLARSVGLPDPFNNSGCVLSGTPRQRAYSVVAQAFDDGSYWLTGVLALGPQQYRFGYAANSFAAPGYPNFISDVYAPVTVPVTPTSPDPVGPVDLLECAGQIRVNFLEDDGAGGFVPSTRLVGAGIAAYPRLDPTEATPPFAYRSGSTSSIDGGAQAQRSVPAGTQSADLFVRESAQSGGPDVRYRLQVDWALFCETTPDCILPSIVSGTAYFEGVTGSFGTQGSGGAESAPADHPGLSVTCDEAQDAFVVLPVVPCGCVGLPPTGAYEGCVNLIGEPEVFSSGRTAVGASSPQDSFHFSVDNLGESPAPLSALFDNFVPANSEGTYRLGDTSATGTRQLQSFFSLNPLGGIPQNSLDSPQSSLPAPPADGTATGTDFCMVPGIYQGTVTLLDALTGGLPSGAVRDLDPLGSQLFGFGPSGGVARRDFRGGSYSGFSGVYTIPYENILGNPDNTTEVWEQPRIEDRFANPSADSSVFVQGGSRIQFAQPTGLTSFDPFDFVSTAAGGNWTGNLVPGTQIAERPARVIPVDYELCYSTLRIQVNTQSAPFFDPQITHYSGSFVDDRGTAGTTDDIVYGVFARETWLGSPQSSASAGTVGFVNMQLPQGNYTDIGGFITTVLGPGLFGTTELPSIDVGLGCGENCTATPNSILCLTPIQGCNDPDVLGGQVAISGTLNHDLDIAAGFYRINDGVAVPIDLGAAGIGCGPPPCPDDFTISVTGFVPCRNKIEITFVDVDGNPISAFMGATIDTTDPVFLVNSALDPGTPPFACGGELRFSPPGDCDSVPEATVPLPVADDDCSSQGDPVSPLIVTDDAPAFFPFGTTVVSFSAVDSCGNGTDCQASVVIEDTTPPSLLQCLPSDGSRFSADADCTSLRPITAFVADNCDSPDELTITHQVTFPDASTLDGTGDSASVDFPLGQSSVTFTATDTRENEATCQSDVEVLDITPPKLFCPFPPRTCFPGGVGVQLPHSEIMSISAPGEVHIREFDLSGIAEMHIETLPVLSFVEDTLLELYLGCDPDGNNLFTGFLDDDSGVGSLSRLVLPPLPPAPDLFGGVAPDAKYVVVVRAGPEDPDGITGNFELRILEQLLASQAAGQLDLENAAVIDPAEILAGSALPIVECEGPDGAFVTLVSPVSDNCGVGSVSNSMTGATLDASTTYPLGTTRVFWNALDESGNAALECTSEIRVLDTTRPVINCPPPLTLVTGASGGLASSDPDIQAWLAAANAADLCGGVTLTHDAPASFPAGCDPAGASTGVTFTATDDRGNVSTCVSYVTVVLACDDGNACTADSCDPTLGCLNVDASASCDDGISCTIDSCDPALGCDNIPTGECPKTIGFYQRLCAGSHPEDELTQADAECVNDSTTFADVASVDDVCSRLHPDPTNDKCEQAESQHMAVRLNRCRGRVTDDESINSLCTDNVTAGQSIADADALLSDPARTFADCERAQCESEELNSGEAQGILRLRVDLLPAEVVRLSWNVPGFVEDSELVVYTLWRRSDPALEFEELSETTETLFDDTTTLSGVDYQYLLTYSPP